MCNDRFYILLTRKLSEEATSTELKELDMLISKLPEKNSTFNKIACVWNTSPSHDEDFMEATYLAHLERMKDKGVEINDDASITTEIERESAPKKWLSFNKMALIGIVAIFIMGGWLFFNSKKTADKEVYAKKIEEVQTPKGTRTKIKLPDGTDVWLNAGSKLNYDKNFDGDLREVYLTGEAFFDVVHNEKKPFIIHTSKINVRVLGTQFNVKAYNEDKTTETSLIKGSVEVFLNNNPSKKFLLKPNQKLVLSNESISGASKKEKEKINPVIFNPKAEILELNYLADNITDVESSWTRNILSFNDEMFADVAKKMERWYDVTIVFKNTRLEREYISGSFEQETLQQSLQALKYTTGFNYKTEGKIVTIY